MSDDHRLQLVNLGRPELGTCCGGFLKWRQEPLAQLTGLPEAAEAWCVCHRVCPAHSPLGAGAVQPGGVAIHWLGYGFERETGKGCDWTVPKKKENN